ncbi:hypothetical protein KBC04_05530 [Candidatus Babeliales bacterium]|nr:hypothetical protein [Candidatus Babeliales bacterium]MBP9844392.1 hypothetical protein [Candidatus Babeliales bacterium]
MKILHKLMLIMGLLVVSTDIKIQALHLSDQVAYSIMVAGLMGASVGIIYTCVDSNGTLLQKADEYIAGVDDCQDMLPPSSWNGSCEDYYAWYMEHKFSLHLSDITEESSKILCKYIDMNQQKLALARQWCQFRSNYFKSMKDKLDEIERLQVLLKQASLNVSLHYDAFFISQSLLQQMKLLQFYFDNTDKFEDMLPPSSWQDSLELYLADYLDIHFSIKLSEINRHSFDTITKNIEKNKKNCVLARQVMYNLHRHGKDITSVENHIVTMELQLDKASLNFRNYYYNFVLAHTMINRYELLPKYDINLYGFEAVNKLMSWIRRSSFSQSRYALLSCKAKLSCDLDTVNSLLASHCNLLNICPVTYKKLTCCYESMERSYDLLLGSSHYQQEKDDKHKEDMLRMEEERVQAARLAAIAAQQAAEAQKRQAYAQEQAAQAQQEAAQAQRRQARAQEEANRIEKEKKDRDKKSRP